MGPHIADNGRYGGNLEGLSILVVAPQPFYEERGTPISTRHLIETLSRLGHRVDLLTYPLGIDVPVAPATVHRSAGLPGVRDVPVGLSWRKIALDVPLCLALARRARPGSYDVVHAVEEAIFPALLLRKRHGAKVVYDMDSSLPASLVNEFPAMRPFAKQLRAIEAWALRRSDLILAVCDDLSEVAVRRADTRGTIRVLRDTPVRADPSGEPIDDLREAWPEGTTLCVYVGNLAGYQGIDLLVRAAEQFTPEDRLGIVVIGGKDAKLAAYRDRVQAGRLDDRIRFVGRRPLGDLAAYLAQADVLISPRTKGGNTPLKIYSYMASGRPIVATRLTTHTQVLDDTTARLFEPSPESLAAALREMAREPEYAARLGAAARDLAESHYSMAAYEDTLGAAYATLAPDRT